MAMEYEQSGGGGGARSLSNTSSSSDLNHSSSSNSISLSHSNSNNNNNNISQQRHHHHEHQAAAQSQQQKRNGNGEEDPMQSWWESVSKARARIQALLSILPKQEQEEEEEDEDGLLSLADSDRPARSLLESQAAYSAVSSALTGSGDDPLCQWLYDTFQHSDPDHDLRLVVLSFVPLLAGLYLTRIHAFSTTAPAPASPSLAGFEAVLLALYSSETKSRAGKPLLVSIPSPHHLAHHPSLYHSTSTSTSSAHPNSVNIGVVSPPLEPQVGIKSTKRACILGVALHCYYKHVSHMPPCSKIDLCRFATAWAGDHHCPCALSLDFNPAQPTHNDDHDQSVSDSLLLPNAMEDQGDRVRIPLPWELLQPLLRILGHCLLAPPPLVSDTLKDAASLAVRRLYARASHDLAPQAILATRSLVQLDNRARASAMAAAFSTASSRADTPNTPNRKPEMLLVSK